MSVSRVRVDISPANCPRLLFVPLSLMMVGVCAATAGPNPANPFQWQKASPESQGMDGAKLDSMKESLAARHTKALLIVRNDRIVCEWYAEGHGPGKPHYTASMAKAIVGGLSLALAIDEGRMALDAPAARFVPSWKGDPRKSKITIRQLGSHTSGIEDAEADGLSHEKLTGWKGDFWKRLDPPRDPFTLARDAAPALFEPGEKMQYSNPGIAMLTYCVTASFRDAAQTDIRTLLRERVMRPIGAPDAEWSVGYGKTYTVDGLPLVGSWGGGGYTARAVARVGRLMLREGDWNGKRLVSRDAVRLVTCDAGTPGNCGIGWWSNNDGSCPELPKDAFWGTGAGHQILLVVPSLNLIAVRNGENLATTGDDPNAFHSPVRRYLFAPLGAAVKQPAPSVREAPSQPMAKITPLVRTVDLDLGETQEVEWAEGSKARLKLLDIREIRDNLRNAVREARVRVEVNGTPVTLTSATYHLPVTASGVQIDCPITRGYIADSSKENAWGLKKAARLRLWPVGSPWLQPGTFAYPVRQRWFASDTQMANEPTFVNGDERLGKTSIYYHYGLDFGGAEGLVEVVAATDGLVVSAAGELLPEHAKSPAKPRYDVVYVVDGRGWYYRYSHLLTIDVKAGQRVRMGERIGLLGKEGGSGGWSHLHFDITSRQPSGEWGIQDAYAYAWQAYQQENRPRILAVARPHRLAAVGEKVVLDGTQSWSAGGTIARYEWTFANGEMASGPSVERVYTQPGAYSEILKVTDTEGRAARDFAVVQVLDPSRPDQLPPTIHPVYYPTADLRPGDPVTFKVRTFRTTDGQERWDFGDGSPPVSVRSDGNANVHAKDGYAVAEHRYDRPGSYLVRVERSNSRGEKAVGHLAVEVQEPFTPRTRASIREARWFINDEITYPGTQAEGLLMNVRMVNAVFEDRNRPDFDPEANTGEFISQIPDYAAQGVRAFTLCLQGGMPGYEGALNSAFNADGSLRASYLRRVRRVIEECDRHGAVVILGCYYQRQDQILQDEAAVRAGVVNTAKWITESGFTNIVLEIANEFAHGGFDHRLLKTGDGIAELVGLAKRTCPGLLVSASGLGHGRLPDEVARASDFLLIHFNGTKTENIPTSIAALKKFGKPIVCNEDEKVGQEGAKAAELSVANGASWGFMHVEVNQHSPFTFQGAADDPAVYGAIKRMTSPGSASVRSMGVPPMKYTGKMPVLRLIIETDAGGDPDDEQSLVRFLLYANEWDIEGIIANRPATRRPENKNPEDTGLGIVRRLLDAYGECRPSLVRHDPRYPTKEFLWQRTVAGHNDTDEAVQLIIAAVDKDDPRPLWYSDWGTDSGAAENNLKRALDLVRRQRGPAGYARFKSRLRLSSYNKFGDHTGAIEPPFPIWVNTFEPPLEGKRWYHRFSALTSKAGGFDMARDVLTGHGPLGALYPTNTGFPGKEGDTMTFLYLVPTGMNDPNEPLWGSWAGRYGPNEDFPGKPYYWANQADAWSGATSRDNTLARWAVDLQNDFRARLDWCVKPPDETNHAPRAVMNGVDGKGILHITAKPGEAVSLDAGLSRDRDDDVLAYEWFVYREAGTYTGETTLADASSSRAVLEVPSDAAGKTLHVVLTIRDGGNPPLAAYRRVIVQVRSKEDRWGKPHPTYFPPPESHGGWRKLDTPGDIRRIAGMDPAKLDDLKQWLLQSDKRNFAAVVIRRGHIVLEVERGNSAKTDSRRVASVSKAVCATVLAIASEQSRQGLTPRKMKFDDPAFDFIPWAQPLSDPRKARITVKQLLNHTSGLCPEATGAPNDGTWEYVLGHTNDPRTAKLAFDPGMGCGYSTHALHHASLVCETVTGKPYDRFAIEALFRPLGIEHWWFQYFDGGEGIGRHPTHGLGMPARDLARIAYCMLHGGRWAGRQVIPAWFVEETAATTHNVQSPEMRWKLNPKTFSHGWELPAVRSTDDGIPADARYKPGSGGQLMAFVPSLDLVITRQTGSSGEWSYEEYVRRACATVAQE